MQGLYGHNKNADGFRPLKLALARIIMGKLYTSPQQWRLENVTNLCGRHRLAGVRQRKNAKRCEPANGATGVAAMDETAWFENRMPQANDCGPNWHHHTHEQ